MVGLFEGMLLFFLRTVHDNMADGKSVYEKFCGGNSMDL